MVKVFKKLLIFFALLLLFAVPLSGCDYLNNKATPDPQPHLIAESDAEENPVRPINANDVSQYALTLSGRARIDELYTVVTDGLRPVFSQNDPVKGIYDAAIAMLDRYMLNSFTSYQKVHSIHDWLVYYIQYDNELYENRDDMQIDASEHPAFNIDGVFLDGVAVCDGISKAFNFLCAIEKIRSVQIKGYYMSDNGASDNHAWNKVYVDGKWYNIDVTMGRAQYRVGSGAVKSILTHGYFLVSDAAISSNIGRHYVISEENEVDYDATTDYPFFSQRGVVIGEKSFSAVVTSQTQLNAIFAAVQNSKRAVGKLELQLKFAGYQTDVPGVYIDEVLEAYEKIKNPDFSTVNSRPFFRYPNDVFVFLIYK